MPSPRAVAQLMYETACAVAPPAIRLTSDVIQNTWEDRGALLRRPREFLESGRRNQFQYQQLRDSTSIRLLYVEPGSRTEVIHCSLRTANLNEDPKYVALSYSWQVEKWSAFNAFIGLGDAQGSTDTGPQRNELDSNSPSDANTKHDEEGSSKTVICNGRIKHISPSLYGALLQLREDRPGREYWIDAVCINQADSEERTSQVKMMGRIYSAAELVVVWLGPFPTFSRPSSAQTTNVLDVTYNPVAQEISAGEGEGEGEDAQWWLTDLFYLTHLISRHYFTRIWVLQEIALAPAVTFFLGRHRFGPEHLSRVVSVIEEQLSATRDTPNLNLVALFLSSVSPRRMYQIKSMPFPRASENGACLRAGGSSLQEWLRMCVGRKARDERDLAFAGLSLIRPDLIRIRWDLLLANSSSLVERLSLSAEQDSRPIPQGQDEEIQLWNELHVDYSASTHEVLVNLGACVLSGPEPMNLLSISSQIRHPNEWRPGGTPSWAPTIAAHPLDMRITLDGLCGTFSAATQLRNDPKISPDGRALVVDAYRLGKVCQSFSPITYLDLKEEEGMSLLEAIRELQKLPCNYRDTHFSTLLVFAHANLRVEWISADTRSRQMLKGFCGLLDFKVRDVLKKREEQLQERRWQAKMLRLMAALSRPANRAREPWRKETERLEKELESLKRDLQPAYAALRKSYRDAPWPAGTGTSLTERESSTERKDKNFVPYNFTRLSVRNLLDRVFFTDSRYIGHTPAQLCVGDEVMLIKGARVPYIFRRVDAMLRKSIQRKEEERETARSDAELERVERLSHEIQSLEGEIGKRDGWLLMGEAYVEGIMDGEAVAQCADHFERIKIF